MLSNTLFTVATSWYEIKAKKLTPETGQRIWNSLENHLFSDLGKTPNNFNSFLVFVASLHFLSPPLPNRVLG